MIVEIQFTNLVIQTFITLVDLSPPTCLCPQIILKEREVRKGRFSVDQNAASPEEQGDDDLHFTDDLTRDAVSQEGESSRAASQLQWLYMGLLF